MTELEELKKLLAEATEAGDWSADENTIWSNARGVPVADVCIGAPVWYRGPKLPYQANAALIVAAVNALPELIAMARRVEELEAENADLKQSVIAFCGPHAVRYGEEFGLGKDTLHPGHYDLLERCGARMVDFKRADLPARTALKEKPQ